MAGIEPEFEKGARRRSGSLSDPDSLCSSTLKPNSGSNRPPSLITDTELVSSISNPDLSRTSNGYIETPIGRGISTRLQVRGGNGNAELRSQRAAKSCTNLITDIEQWLLLIKDSPPPSTEEILDSYESFKRRVQRTYQEAMLQRVDIKLTFHISELQTKLEKVKQRAERSLRKENPRLNDRHSMDSDIEVDNMLDLSGDHSVPPLGCNEIGETVESPINPEVMNSEFNREHELPRFNLSNNVSEIRDLINKSLNSTPPPPPPSFSS